MTYEEMLEKVGTSGGYIQGYEWERMKGKPSGRRPARKITGKEYIESRWVSGGVCGGNCWGGSPDRPVDAEPEKDLGLDMVLEALCPQITYLQFKRLERKVIRDQSTQYEYYGNYTNYQSKRLMMKDLYEELVEMQLI